MELYGRKIFIYGKCMIRSFGDPGNLCIQKLLFCNEWNNNCLFYSNWLSIFHFNFIHFCQFLSDFLSKNKINLH